MCVCVCVCVCARARACVRVCGCKNQMEACVSIVIITGVCAVAHTHRALCDTLHGHTAHTRGHPLPRVLHQPLRPLHPSLAQPLLIGTELAGGWFCPIARVFCFSLAFFGTVAFVDRSDGSDGDGSGYDSVWCCLRRS